MGTGNTINHSNTGAYIPLYIHDMIKCWYNIDNTPKDTIISLLISIAFDFPRLLCTYPTTPNVDWALAAVVDVELVLLK